MADQPNWFTHLQFSLTARDSLCIIEGHFQLNLFNPKDVDSTRIALNDGRLYQYMRIIFPRWTSYKLETLLIIGAAMNVGAHLNSKFWQALELLCALNEKESENFCELHTTRMLASARALYKNVKEGEGQPMDFEALQQADLMRSAVKVMKEQKGDTEITQWPEDDLDNEGYEKSKIDQRRASWRRCPIERADYWDNVERCGQGLPNFPNNLMLATHAVHSEKKVKTKSSRSSLSLPPTQTGSDALETIEVVGKKLPPIETKAPKKRAASSRVTSRANNKRTKRTNAVSLRKAASADVEERAVSEETRASRSRTSPDGTIDDETNFPQTPKVTRAITRSQKKPLNIDPNTSGNASELLEVMLRSSFKAASPVPPASDAIMRGKFEEKEKKALRKRKLTPAKSDEPPSAMWDSSPQAALLRSSPEKTAPVAVSVHSFRKDSSPLYPVGPKRVLEYGRTMRMELPAYVPGSGIGGERRAILQNGSPSLHMPSRYDKPFHVTTSEMMFPNLTSEKFVSRSRLPHRDQRIPPRESNDTPEVVVNEGRAFSMSKLRNAEVMQEELGDGKPYNALRDGNARASRLQKRI